MFSWQRRGLSSNENTEKQGENKTAKIEKERPLVLTLIHFLFLKPQFLLHTKAHVHTKGCFQTLYTQLFNYTGDTINYIAP